MNDNTIDSLREALKHSPDNTPLRLLLADTLLASNKLEEAEKEYSTLLKISNNNKAKVGLATIFFKKESYSACIVILEEVIETGTNDVHVYTLYAKALLKENSVSKAIDSYKELWKLMQITLMKNWMSNYGNEEMIRLRIRMKI